MKHVKSLLQIIGKLNFMLTKEQKGTGIVVMMMIVIGSFLDMLGVSAILPFIEAILTPDDILGKWYVKPIIEIFHPKEMATVTIIIGICIILIYILKNAYLYASVMIQTIYRSKIQKKLSTRMLRAYMKRPYEYFININTAEVIRGIGTDIIGVYNLLDNLFRFFGEFLTALLVGIYIVLTDAFMAICIIVIAGCCFILITLGLKRKTRYLGEQKRETDTVRNNWALQAVMGFKEIKVTQTADYFVEGYEKAYENQRIADVKNEYIVNLPEKLIEAMCVAVLLGIICVKIKIGTDMIAFVPKLAVFAVAAFRLLPSISRMTRYMNGVIFNNAFLQSAYDNLVEIQQFENSDESKTEIEDERKIEFCKELKISHISWNYAGNDKEILSDLSLTIYKGEAIGLIGASGAGKTTLADIVLGLLKPRKGTIFMDGIDIYSCPAQWSKIIGYVPQSVFLANDTIRNNVAFGHTVEEIDDKKVWEVLREAQLEKFVEELPDKLDTQVGERGIKFSGGQRQRIAIARALYNEPSIVVLDEATSALDNETEKAVMEAIEALQGYKTLIIVAHRLTTIKQCDKIYEIVNGKIEARNKADIFGENIANV